jgi:hypothetical protein
VASEGKDHEHVVRFLSLYAKLRDMSDDDPVHVQGLAKEDEDFRKVCRDLSWMASLLHTAERSQRPLYAAPVDPQFVSAWRDFEERFDSVLAGIFLEDLGMVLDTPSGELSDRSAVALDHAEDAARESTRAIESVIDFAESSIAGEHHEYDDEFVEQIEPGLLEWKRLHVTLNLCSVLTRRKLVPFVLIPRHVAAKHSPAQAPSLFEHLKQAHEAFVFGAPLASLALVRSVLELVLRNHYGTNGDLEEQIRSVTRLPRGVTRSDLYEIRRLAVLHFSTERVAIPEDIERQMVKHLDVLRRLIEGAPGIPLVPVRLMMR